MPLKAVLDSLDDIPEAQREFYDEDGGKFVLQLDDIDSHPKVINLKTAHEKTKQDRRRVLDEVKTLKEKYSSVPEDFNAEEYVQLKELKAELDKGGTTPEDKTKNAEAVAARKMLEQKITAIEAKHTNAVKALEAKLASKETFIAKLLIDDGLTKALMDGGVDPKLLKAAKAMLRENVKVTEDGDGDYSAIVETDMGSVDVQKFVSDWISSDEGKVFVVPAKGADAGTGTGKQGTGNKSNEPNPWSKDTWNLTQQGQLLMTDRAKAEKLAKAAGKTIPVAA
jgi:hypothetical protein